MLQSNVLSIELVAVSITLVTSTPPKYNRILATIQIGRATPITRRQQFGLCIRATVPHRSNGVDDVPRAQTVTVGALGIAGFATTEQSASVEQLRASGTVNGAIDTAATKQRFIRRIDDCINIEGGDVSAQRA